MFETTSEYLKLKFVVDRLKTKNTLKNMRYCHAYLIKAIRLADRKYGSYGLDKSTGLYSWAQELSKGWADYEREKYTPENNILFDIPAGNNRI